MEWNFQKIMEKAEQDANCFDLQNSNGQLKMLDIWHSNLFIMVDLENLVKSEFQSICGHIVSLAQLIWIISNVAA